MRTVTGIKLSRGSCAASGFSLCRHRFFGCLALNRLLLLCVSVPPWWIFFAIAHQYSFHTDHRRQALNDRPPGLAVIPGAIDLAASGPKVNARRPAGIGRQRVEQDFFHGILLRQPARERFPALARITGPIDTQLAFRRAA